MALHRTAFSRIIAVILAVALASQGVGAQVTRCAMDGALSARMDHAAMSHSLHDGSVSVTINPDDSSQGSSRSDLPCMQSLLCATAPALVTVSPADAEAAHPFAPITVTTASLEARSLRPDSPPPKL